MKHYETLLFLIVILAGVIFARLVYPNISVFPSLADNTSPQTADVGQATAAPATLVLPQTTFSATAQPDGTGADVAASTGTTPLPVFTNSAYLVANLSANNIVAGSNITSRWPTASITKLMTATLVLDQLSPTTTITITPQMFAADPDEYTLAIGGRYSVEDLLHMMLMPSSNVAAQALADTIGQTQFLNEMNARARAWGMTDTYFSDPSGISAANESTASDLMMLAKYIYAQYPQILALTNTPVATITELNNGRKITVRSINQFAGAPGFVGGKTGNTPQAGYNLFSIFNDAGTPVFITVLGAPALPFGDTSILYSWYKRNYNK